MFKIGICPIFMYVGITEDVVMKLWSQPEDGQRAESAKCGLDRNRGAIPVGAFCQATLGLTATCITLPYPAVVIGGSVRDTGCYLVLDTAGSSVVKLEVHKIKA
jgi:hypothetical protein